MLNKTMREAIMVITLTPVFDVLIHPCNNLDDKLLKTSASETSFPKKDD
jgi:hypothetical protein